jgi:hypothetical protein
MSIIFNETDAQNNQFISGVLVLYWYYVHNIQSIKKLTEKRIKKQNFANKSKNNL